MLDSVTAPTPARAKLAMGLAALVATLLLASCATAADQSAPAAAAPATVAGTQAEVSLPTITPAGGGAAQSESTNPPAEQAVEPIIEPELDNAVESATAPFDPDATPLRLESVADGLEMPVFLTHAGDGSDRLFVLEKVGRIRVIADGAVVPTPFLDISDRVGSSSSEQGLLGLAFAPDYATSGTFFVDYTNRQGDTVISRFQVSADPMIADVATESLVLTFAQPATNHNGGMILFGPDGMLWIGTGDGGAANDRFGNGQNPQTLLGKMLRIDVTSDPAQPYTIPADNPWVDAEWNGQPVRGEIWALGLRNPWRYSFDAATDDLWIADVGQNTWEEVNLVPAGSAGGLNFGWPIQEGTHCFQQANCDPAGLVQPVIEYDHSGNCSVTGGYVYRGAAPAMQGVYFYADYCSTRIWAATPPAAGDANVMWESVLVLQGESPITSWGEDAQGELYVVEASGRISRLVEDK